IPRHDSRTALGIRWDNKYLIDQRPGNFGRGWDIYGGKDSRLRNLLVLGDSHAFDFFQILKASKYSKLYNVQMCDFSFVYFEGGIKRPQKCFDGGRFANAQIVVISDNFAQAELKYVDSLVKFLLAKGKAVVLLGRSLRWEKKPQLRTFLDEIYVENGNSFDGVDFSKETKNFYRARSSGEEVDIDFLRAVAEKNEILFLDKRDYQCDMQMGRCDLVTTQLKKIYSDSQHVTLEGAQHFGLKISEMEWFNIE
ncbi:MAG: SGNH hydrolase domain-containing protein, partial [bacterium]|nr:SGNH hydrolase domain-containing protein [bacterium]